MAAQTKFQSFVGELCSGTHNFKAAGHLLKAMLTLTAPVATNDVKADLTEIAAGNGYTAGGEDTQNDMSETGGTATITMVDITWVSSGAGMANFQYASHYNDTPTSPLDPLVTYVNYGSVLDLGVGESFTLDYGASFGTVA